ncbi:hypothetical protein CSA37_02905 [Candidatus Fermentibacteria bacterium]|nr:MAG: hypothetical protein CSA37_02905 [Candidatus Fermentibacteria bacterium]
MKLVLSPENNLLWLCLLAVAALATRLPHLIALANPSTDMLLTYAPTLAAARFEQCARAILHGTEAGNAFAFASPMYILLLVPVYASGLTDISIFIIQSLAGIVTAYAVFFLAFRLGSSRHIAFSASLLWIFYAPAALYEAALLPVSVLSLLIILWAHMETGMSKTVLTLILLGLTAGMITTLRPPFILLGGYSIIRRLVRRDLRSTILVTAGFAVPLLAVSAFHYHEDGVFSPFASSLGINLIQGHAEGASGYGPPIPEYGLIENTSENIHEVGVRVAAERGCFTESEANRFWLNEAITWILNNPSDELHLIGVKLGAFSGFLPFDSYFDLARDIESDSSLKHLILPRSVLMLLLFQGLFSWLFFSKKNWYVMLPFTTVFITTVVFFPCERYWVPAIPVSLALAASGTSILIRKINTDRWKSLTVIFLALLALLPGLLWPVPEIPEGMYFFNRGVKAFNMNNHVLALRLFEESIRLSPPRSTIAVQARVQSVNIAASLGMTERAREHLLVLQELGIAP